ncbi:uncharacterized protein MELLADRAFT_93730 [Melampsora larici-populina 98AG31]|uniref:RNA polymerase Rpb2 domain-containing protein n=1 Tax=Melampsora larici-populina (strain 98AG31 / pathotype 3-4-7) TaxID=747676 RepID=F4S523_MELLP|nr:uncharacterized protein MELLADRAFT_93730 [Melampsora larici-populina 98AG31]EGG00243.1 hypothetical protein MELLADRAFT_93730 [Melampsora larici-populina 98AG31]
MELNAFLAHGTSFSLQDILMNCSDYSTAWICRECDIYSNLMKFNGLKEWDGIRTDCKTVESHMDVVEIPFF